MVKFFNRGSVRARRFGALLAVAALSGVAAHAQGATGAAAATAALTNIQGDLVLIGEAGIGVVAVTSIYKPIMNWIKSVAGRL